MHRIIPAGENSIIIYFGDQIDPSLPEKIAFTANQLKQEFNHVIIDMIPSYISLHISYHLTKTTHQNFCQQVEKYLNQLKKSSIKPDSKLTQIPVYYHFDVGFDLARLLKEKQLNLENFINIHSSKIYQVYAIGFSPAFAFLASVDKKICAPRLATPRIKIPAGSLGIADPQTAIYPSASSGGWNIIGRTPLDLSLTHTENLKKFNIGDKVKFCSIGKDEYLANGGSL
ncbi:MAG: 5-oxoprolinase subunit PxpB [Methylococcales bacterium]|nr:5-oxoprolinase subunit PxpB [Methylococcales bacterium]